jgi:uncharacterized protein YhfF
MTPSEMWNEFLKRSGIAKDTPYEAWHFCDDKESADHLAHLTLKGIKRATASLHAIYEHEHTPIPTTGDLSVITDWHGEAVCIIETISVEVLPFASITSTHAEIEGEGDRSLTYWREVHTEYFSREMAELGLQFNGESLVVFEIFSAVHPENLKTT